MEWFFPLTLVGAKFRLEQFRFGDMLTQLQSQVVFQLHEFEKVIDSIRDCVAEVSPSTYMHVIPRDVCMPHVQLLWSLLVEDSDLAGHLQVTTSSKVECSVFL